MNSFCSMYCPDRQTIWEIDSLVLAPGQEAWVDLGSFLSECYSSAVLNLCLSTLAPNKLADGDTQNDLHCQQVTPLLIDANASIVDTRISVFPNPAHDQITLIYTGNWSKAEIISITGVNVLSVPLDTAPATLDVSNLVPGLYLVLVQRDNGDQQFAKVMIE